MELSGWVALSLTEHLGSKTLRALLDHFNGDMDAVFTADSVALRRVPGIGPKIAASIQALDRAQVAQAITRWQAEGVSIVPAFAPAYPPRLKTLTDAPATLFLRGQLPSEAARHVAIVGTRTPTPSAAHLALHISRELAQQGVVIVSGLARGVDADAHLGALQAKNGRTLAVLGCGVLRVYPPENQVLAGLIQREGALISEVAPNAAPSTPRLVARNRLISGLSDAVLIIESSAEGGAMYAARRAQEQGRPVYTLDLPASGNQALIAGGAQALRPDLRAVEALLS